MELPVSQRKGDIDTKSLARLKAELAKAFAVPDSAYAPLDADTVIERNLRKA